MPYLLDAMSKTGRDTCSCAFAVYRLSAGYTGPTIDVYNSGTGVTTSFYADIYGNLGTALNATGTTIASSLGANVGYVTKWYDQSGNSRHATRAYTAAPKIDYTNKLIDFTTYSGTAYLDLPSGSVPEKQAYTVTWKTGTVGNTGSGGIVSGGNAANYQSNNFRFNGTGGFWNYWYFYDAPLTLPETYTAGTVATFKFDGLNLGAGGTTYAYYNSVLTTTTPNASRSGYSAGTTWDGRAGNEKIGTTVVNENLNGQLYYLAMFTSALSDPDRFAVENLSPYNKISFIPTTGPIDFLNVGAATNQTSGPIDLGTLQSQYKTFGGGTVDLNTCYSLVNGFNPSWCMDAANYQSGTKWKDANTINNYDMTIAAAAYTPSWNDGTPTMQFDGSSSGTRGVAKRVVSGALAQVPFTASGTTMVSFNAINNLKGVSTSYDWNWRTLYRSLIPSADIQPYHPVIIEYGLQNSGSSRMGNYIGYFASSGTDIVTGPVPVPYAYQQHNMLVHKFRNTSPYYEYQLNNVMTTYTITDVNASLNASSGTATIGSWHHSTISVTDADQYWGNVATVFMYNSILTNTQLQDLYTRFSPRFYGFNNPALGVLPVTSGLVGWYDGESWTGTQWTDKSGSGNHVTTYTGTINVTTFTNNVRKYLYGTAGNARMTWPAAILPSTYTLFHVAKYNGATRGRIFDGVTQNWLSGFWGTYSGLAYHQGWIGANAGSKTVHGTNWVISSDQNTIYRSQGYERGNTGAGTAGQTYAQLTINNGAGSSETSDWAVATVIVFNRTLTTAEMQTMEKWLNITYNVVAAPNLTPILVNPGTQSYTTGGSATITQSVVGTGTITWAYSPSTSGISFTATADTSATLTVASGTMVAAANYTVTATNPSGVVCTSVFSIKCVPAGVTGITQGTTTSSSIQLNFTTASGATSYSITSSPATTTQTASGSGYVFTGLAGSTAYTFTITSVSSVSGNGGATTSGSFTTSAASLYTMTFPFTFTNMGATGASGPTSITYGTSNPGYGTAYAMVLGTGTSAGMQRWTVPITRSYTFTIAGAGRNYTNLTLSNPYNVNYSAYGVIGTCTLSLTAGHVIRILVGQQGTQGSAALFARSGGNGGSFVYNETTSTLLLVAGGGGGNAGDPGSATIGAGTAANPYTNGTGKGDNGQTGTSGSVGRNGNGGAAGTAGGGGGANLQGYGGMGGGGYSGNGGVYTTNGDTSVAAKSFTTGGTGGTGGASPGGFGGGGGGGTAGGAGAGGGGGYSGGGGGANQGNGEGGGGGGSYTAGTWTSISATTNLSNGYVTVS